MHEEYYGIPSTPTSDYLAHYGVLGMKWGIRRAAKKGTTYQYKSHATKKYEKAAAKLAAKAAQNTGEKAAKLSAKSKVMANRAKRSSEIDRGEEDYARSLSTGKAIGLAALGGTNMMKAYAQHRAMSGGKGNKYTSSKGLAGVEAAYMGTLGSRARKAGYIRQDENKKGLNAGAHRVLENARKNVPGYSKPGAATNNQSTASQKKKKPKQQYSESYKKGMQRAGYAGGLIGATAYAIKNRNKK